MIYIVLTIAVAILISCKLLALILPSRYHPPSLQEPAQGILSSVPNVSVQILVLGDIGHSPRMQNHALSISKKGGQVSVIGYEESSVHPELCSNPLVTIIPLPQLPKFPFPFKLPFAVVAPVKVMWQVWSLFMALGYRTKPSRWLLVQNPPSIPTLIISIIICFIRQTHLIIDWHNLGWTILAGKKGASHPYVTIYKYYEAILGRWAATANFVVSNSMRRALQNPPYNICSPIFTLYDRPALDFQPITTIQTRCHFLEQLPETSKFARSILSGSTKLIVSSTSWTQDEDFDILLQALCSYASCSENLPSLLVIITGKGPQKQHYLDCISSLNSKKKLDNVFICTTWLSTANYAALLASADLGVCLHKSSSGLDLPMKVVDMFGAGLPVVGYKAYESWKELVIEGVNGRGFVSGEELSSILQELLSDKNGEKLAKLRAGALNEGKKTWDEEWNRVAARVIGVCD
ncbi:Chitobiosyldiphosphodolichol beta-mannosyltransferase [Erysiphe necator]|nr:Chitobiosyldiphosphodolichol beta-mannosyltransferase [Erysiphe necator]